MINIKKKADCSGCHACVNVCPKKCIVMEADEEGFLYPSVNSSECVKCGLCQRVCHHHSASVNNGRPEAYACYASDEAIHMQSSSGGIFTLLAKEILNRGGAVFGAAFDEDWAVKHICVTQEKDLGKLRGSKYVQSCIGQSYSSAKRMLERGQWVLFTGTPCQIDGLKLYLGKEYDNLYTADVICHGAPSPKIWETYLKHIEGQYHNKVNKCAVPSFRHKTPGESGYSVCIPLEDGAQYCAASWQDSYIGAFVNDLTLRPSCYHCEHKSLHRSSDITMADFWGVDQVLPDLYDHKGTSLVLIHSAHGKELFDCVKEAAVYQPAPLDEAIKHNPSAYKSAPCPFKRKKFMDNVTDKNFTALYQTCMKKGLLELVYHKGNRFLESIGRTKRGS